MQNNIDLVILNIVPRKIPKAKSVGNDKMLRCTKEKYIDDNKIPHTGPNL